MTGRMFARLALGTATLALLTGVAQAEEARMGALVPMTGDLQAYGVADLKGAQLAQEQINTAGGVLGSEMKLLVGDTQTKSQAGIDAAKKLTSVNKVAGIVGALSSGVTIPVAKSVTADVGIPQISPASTSPVITTLDDNDFLFRTVPSDAFQGVALAQVTGEAGHDKVAVLYVNNDYGDGLAKAFQDAFVKEGGTVTGMSAYEPGNASYRGELSQLAKNDPQALLLIGYPENGITILRQALEEGFFSAFVFSDGMKAPEVVDAIGAQHLNGSVGTAPQAQSDTESAQRFLKAYQEKFGEMPPKPYIDTTYDAAFVLALAIEQAGSTDGAAVRDSLRPVANPPGEKILPGEWVKAKTLIGEGKDIDYVGASGSINFDQHGDVAGTFAKWVIKDGTITTEKVFEPK